MSLRVSRRGFLKIAAATGALALIERSGLRFLKPARASTIARDDGVRYVPSLCAMCPADCNILVRVRRA